MMHEPSALALTHAASLCRHEVMQMAVSCAGCASAEARQRPMPTFEVEDDGFGDLAQSSLGLLAQLHGDDDPDDTSSEDDGEGGAMRQRRDCNMQMEWL